MELWKNEESLYLRLLYDGEDLTPLIPSCTKDIIRVGQAFFCPFPNFLTQVDGLLSPHRNRRKACQAQ
jgi:hypothetical protein